MPWKRHERPDAWKITGLSAFSPCTTVLAVSPCKTVSDDHHHGCQQSFITIMVGIINFDQHQ